MSPRNLCRFLPPALSIFIISLGYTLLSGWNAERQETSASSAWIGPKGACPEWDRILTDGTEAFVSSNLATDDTGDIYLTDSTSDNATAAITFRLRKLSAAGARVFDSPLYAQVPVESAFTTMAFGLHTTLSPQVNAQPRLFTSILSHELSNTLLVVQQGDFNTTTAFFDDHEGSLRASVSTNVAFSALSLHSSADGSCLWGISYVQPASSGGSSLSPCIASVGAVDEDYRIAAITTSQSAIGDACDQFSYVASIGWRAGRAQLAVHKLEYSDCAETRGFIAPTLTAAWLTYLGLNTLPSDAWSTETASRLVSVYLWSCCTGTGCCSDVPASAGVVLSAMPVATFSTLPASFGTPGDAGSEIYAYNVSSAAEIWSLSSVLPAGLVIAVISNVEVSPAGIVYFAAVRNVTVAVDQYPDLPDISSNSTIDGVVIALDIRSGALLWQSKIVPLNHHVLDVGMAIQTVQLHVTDAGLVFCSYAPQLNATYVNGSLDSLTELPSGFGLGVVDTAGGQLVCAYLALLNPHAMFCYISHIVQLWHDSEESTYPAVTNFVTTRVSYCVSSILADDTSVYAVVVRRATLGELAEIPLGDDVELPYKYTTYSRLLLNGAVQWSVDMGDVSSPPSFLNYYRQVQSPTSPLAAAGQFRSRLIPISLAAAVAGRLLLKVDPTAIFPILTAQGGNDKGFEPYPVAVVSARCLSGYDSDFTWVYIFGALLVSLGVVRIGYGSLIATVSCRRYAPKSSRVRNAAGLSTPQRAPDPGTYQHLAVQVPGKKGGDHPDDSEAPEPKESESSDSIGDDLDELCTIHFTRMFKRESCSSCRSACSHGAHFLGRPKRGTPWVLLSIVHYITMMALLGHALSTARVSIQSLQMQLNDPARFYLQYLINRSPTSGTNVCASSIASACYCVADDINTGPAPVTAGLQGSCNTFGVASCSFDLAPCGQPCSVTMEQSGNCGASVFEYQCGCSANDCSETTFVQNSTFRTDGMGGLLAGLHSCAGHYDTIYIIMTIAVVGYALFAVLAITFLLSMWKFWRRAAAAIVAAAFQYFCPHRQPPSWALPFSAHGDRAKLVKGTPARPGRTSSMSSPIMTLSAATPVTASRLIAQGSGRGGRAGSDLMTPTHMTPSKSSRAERTEEFRHRPARDDVLRALLHPNAAIKAQSRRVSLLVYLAMCQIGLMLGSLLWSWFLVLQGRYCTGADGDGSGINIPIVGNLVSPSSSLILRPIPGCAFGSEWQDEDFEGAALRSVWLSMAAQVLAMVVLIVDQGLALIQACFTRCNVVARAHRHKMEPSPAPNTGRKCGQCPDLFPQSWHAVLDTRAIFIPDVWLQAFGTRVFFCCPTHTTSGQRPEQESLLSQSGEPRYSSVAEVASHEDEERIVTECGVGCCTVVFGGPPDVDEWLDGTTGQTLI
jgi:hypothetical protein